MPASLAEDFAYWLANPSSPAFNEGTNMVEFWGGYDGLISFLNEAGMLSHPDIATQRSGSIIWNTHLSGQTFHGVTFTTYYGTGNQPIICAVNF